MSPLKMAMAFAKDAIEAYETEIWNPDYLKKTIEHLLEEINLSLTPKTYVDPQKTIKNYYEGELHYLPINGRWQIGGVVIFAGMEFEIYQKKQWQKVRMHFNGKEYCIISPIKLVKKIKARIPIYF